MIYRSHASALAGCHRYYKRTNREEGQKSNFSGFEDINDSFIMKDPVEHRRNAMIWKHQLTKEDRNQHVKRIPYKIATGERFLGYTADQWKTFIMIYAIPIMWDLLDEADQQILTHFVMACFLLTARIIEDSALDEAHSGC